MQTRNSQILVVDDEVAMQRLLQQRFRKKIQAGVLNFHFAQNGLEALQILQNSNDMDMVLTDIRMPEMDGLTLLGKLSEFETPLKAVVISAFGDMKNIRTAMNRGAFDFLTKPIDFQDLEITIDKTLSFVSNLRQQKQQLQEALDRLHRLAFYDSLTGLPNFNGLAKALGECLEEKQNSKRDFALLFIDIERYTTIKSGFGYQLAERLISAAAQRLEEAVNATTVLARVGESSFALLWQSLDSLETYRDKVDAVLDLLQAPFRLDGITIASKTRKGVALSTLPYTQPEGFAQAAGTAMQLAEQRNSKDVVVFDLEMQNTAIQRLKIEIELQEAIETGQLALHYQPIFQLETEDILGFEALVRWQHPTRGTIPPFEFIPIAEETGLIVPLGEWVLTEACRQLGHWQEQFGNTCPPSISVNLSSLQLQSTNLLEAIDYSVAAAGISGSSLTLEITESVLMDNIEEAIQLLTQLKDRDIRLSIDDFGTGYSSLSYLQTLPIDSLKIDRSFVKDISNNPANYEIASTIVSLARSLELDVVAEGLEQQEHIDLLKSLSCTYGQGYFFSRPLEPAKATELIARHSN